MEREEQSQEPFISGIRLPGESLPKIPPDYATDGLTEPLKPIVREGGLNEDERLIYEMILRLAAHQMERGQYQEAFTSSFIAKEIAKGSHRAPPSSVQAA